MERIFPIRCNILGDSPNLTSDPQKEELEKQQVVLIPTPAAEMLEPTLTIPAPSPTEGVTESDLAQHFLAPVMSNVGFTSDSPVQQSTPLIFTERLDYALSPNQEHGVRTGKRAQFTRCDEEPIHIPGAIQSHGMLVGLDMAGDGGSGIRYVCRVVSENSESICRYAPRNLLDIQDFSQIFPPDQRLLFHSKALDVRYHFRQKLESDEPVVLSVKFWDTDRALIPAWCAMHFVGGDHNLLICEFEPDHHPEDFIPSSHLPSTPIDTLSSDPSDAPTSFESKSEPLSYAADTASMFQSGRTMDLLHAISQIQRQLSTQTTIQRLLDTVVGLVKELTGYHRCMAYRFDEDYNGTVVSELLDPRASSDIFKGLCFPATDIPSQARDLYRINRVRVLFDRAQQPSLLICKATSDLKSPLDLTHSYLRAMSPVHLKYLQNMGVQSTMSVSLDHDDRLWGLICCHSYGPTGKDVPFPARELCYWLGLSASSCLEKLLQTERLQARQYDHEHTFQLEFGSKTWLSTSSAELLRLFKADFGFLVIQGEARTIGNLSSYLEAVTLLKYVYFRNFRSVFASSNISKDFKDLVYAPGFNQIAGILCIPLSQTAGDFVILFRATQEKEVHWAGNPISSKEGQNGQLEPRNSFKKWTEQVRGTCSPWTEAQFEAASLTRLVYGNFIRVWREKEAVLHATKMKRLLIENLAHEVRTPLNIAINYLEMAMEQSPNKKHTDMLSVAHSASTSLAYVIDDLLHLTGGLKRPPPHLLHLAFDLPKSLQATTNYLQEHAIRKGLAFDVIREPGFPQFVLGDVQRMQQAVANLIVNSIQYTDHGNIEIHLGVVSATPEKCTVKVIVSDTGIGLSERELDQLFQEFEQVPDEESEKDESSEEPIPSVEGNAQPKPSKLGLGLALVARYIKHSNGQIRGRSQPGVGSTFSLEIPFDLTSDVPSSLNLSGTSSANARKSENGGRSRDSGTGSGQLSATHRRYQRPGVFGHRKSEGQSSSASSTKHRSRTPSQNDLHRAVDTRLETAMVRDNLTIIVAEDNSVNSAILSRRLSKMGHKVKVCRDGQQCLDAVLDDLQGVDFVLMDINMPMVDGVQAAKMIRAIEDIDVNDESTAGVSSTMSTPDSPQQVPVKHRRLSTPYPSSSSQLDVEMPIAPVPMGRSKSAILEKPGVSSFPQPITPSRSPQMSYFSTVQRHPSPAFCTSSIIPLPQSPRISIFAVSASLDQYSLEYLQAAGFDGSLPKPIDFARLGFLLQGMACVESRARGRYRVEDAKAGGWYN